MICRKLLRRLAALHVFMPFFAPSARLFRPRVCMERHDFPDSNPVAAIRFHSHRNASTTDGVKYVKKGNFCRKRNREYPTDEPSRELFAYRRILNHRLSHYSKLRCGVCVICPVCIFIELESRKNELFLLFEVKKRVVGYWGSAWLGFELQSFSLFTASLEYKRIFVARSKGLLGGEGFLQTPISAGFESFLRYRARL